MTEGQKKISIGAVVIVLCALVFYFFYWVKTPIYSLNIVREAVKMRDIDTFERHVDVEQITTRAVDSYLYVEAKKDNMLNNPFAVIMIQSLKPVLVERVKIEIRGLVQNPDANTTETNGNSNGGKTNGTQDKSTWSVKDIEVISKNNGIAMVDVVSKNNKRNQDFTFKIKMKELSDGKWQIVELINAAEVFNELK